MALFSRSGNTRTCAILETQFEIWEPEGDTSIYCGTFRPVAPSEQGDDTLPQGRDLTPPSCMDAGPFFDLVEQRRKGLGADCWSSLDQATNNTSVVFRLT